MNIEVQAVVFFVYAGTVWTLQNGPPFVIVNPRTKAASLYPHTYSLTLLAFLLPRTFLPRLHSHSLTSSPLLLTLSQAILWYYPRNRTQTVLEGWVIAAAMLGMSVLFLSLNTRARTYTYIHTLSHT